MAPLKLPGLPAIDLGDIGVLTLVIGYCLCSSLLSVINKVALTVFPYPSLLTALQYAVSASSVWILGRSNVLQHEPLMWDKVLAYLPAAIVFYLAIFTNANVLKYANLETFIVFRSSSPIIVAFADTIFRNQPLPSLATFGSLLLILLGAVGYVLTDSAFSVAAYSWAVAYLSVITLEMVYIKHIVHSLGLSTWGYVFYNNTLSLAMAPLFWLVTLEYKETTSAAEASQWLHFATLFPVALSCAVGLGISFFGFATRTAISATSFTVLGVTNKLLTIVVNVSIWDKHASPVGIFCLLLTIVGGVAYQQSVTQKPKPVNEEKIEEKEILLQNTEGSNAGTILGGEEQNRLSVEGSQSADAAPFKLKDLEGGTQLRGN